MARNKDRISRTPGGEQMLAGVLVFGFGLLAYQGLQYQLGNIGTLVLLVVMGYGAVLLGRGIYLWKYSDHAAFAEGLRKENLFVDVPLKNLEVSILHVIEDALIDLVRTSKSIRIDIHSVDTANNMGTIHLSGREADAMFAHIYSTLARFALPNGIHLFPKPGQPIDAAIHGKRVLLDMPKTEVIL